MGIILEMWEKAKFKEKICDHEIYILVGKGISYIQGEEEKFKRRESEWKLYNKWR